MRNAADLSKFVVVAAALATSLLALGPVQTAHAQSAKAKKQAAARIKKAMESYDGLDFEGAKAALSEVIAQGQKAGLDKDPVLAQAYLDLGIVEYAGLKDEDGARKAFAAAVAIKPDIDIGVAYKTKAMAALLAEVKQGGGGGADSSGDTGSGADDEIDCATIEGIQHTLVDTGTPGQDQVITAKVGDSVGADKVALFYRTAGTSDFTEVAMSKQGGCTYSGAIPGAGMHGEAVHYYVAAFKGTEILTSKGSKRSPNIIELSSDGAGGTGPDSENPLGGDTSSGSVSAGTTGDESPHHKPTVFLSLALGTGGGYVTGATEVADSDVGCCFAPALLHVFPEVGYYITRQLAASLAVRMGFTMGANVMGHATVAPALLARVRYAFKPSGTGWQVSGALGGGIIRNTVKVEDAQAGMDTDTTASGPFLIGGGVGYVQPVSDNVQFVGELNGLAAVTAGIKELGGCPGSGCVRPHFGFEFDVNLGVLFAF